MHSQRLRNKIPFIIRRQFQFIILFQLGGIRKWKQWINLNTKNIALLAETFPMLAGCRLSKHVWHL